MKLFGSNHLNARIAVVCLAIGLLAGTPLARAGKKQADTDATPANAAASPTPTPPKFTVPIPVGHDAEGFRMPYFDNRGRLEMYFNIKKAVRADLNHLNLENAFMQTYDDKAAPDANVYMSRSVLDLNTRIVTSDLPVTVRRADFEIVGQKMTFNTQTRIGHMSGHVRMIIYNHQEMSQSPPSASPTPAPSAAPQPSATPQ
jgi:hypothetical protein